MGCSSSGAHADEAASAAPQPPILLNCEDQPNLPPFTIYHGSQTGNATRFANELFQEAKKKYGLEKCSLTDLGSFDEKEITSASSSQALIIIIISTYGEGGPTDNAQRFYQWLINEHCIARDKAAFSGIQFAIFGCGDSNFKKTFNRMAKLAQEKLLARSAKQVGETGLGDDSKNLNEDFKTWKSKLWPALINLYQSNKGSANHIPIEQTKKKD